MSSVQIILGILGVMTLAFAVIFLKDIFVTNKDDFKNGRGSFVKSGIIGFVTDFFDTLGIGSFAPTMAAFKISKEDIEDHEIPGTLNVSHTIPVVIEAFIFITAITVAPLTLIVMLAAATIGGFVGAGIVSKLNKDVLKMVVGFALLATGILMLCQQLGLIASLGDGNTATALTGGKLIIGAVCNFILGVLMCAGIGLYAPCMALVYMLGLSPDVAFPIMMGSCAFLMPIASIRFIKEGKYARRPSFAITVCGTVGVLIAAFLVTSMPIKMLTWLVVIVILYTSLSMLIPAFKQRSEKK